MIKVVLIVMLVMNDTGEVKAVQQPKGFATAEECENAAGNFKTNLPGSHVEWACVPGHAYTPT